MIRLESLGTTALQKAPQATDAQAMSPLVKAANAHGPIFNDSPRREAPKYNMGNKVVA